MGLDMFLDGVYEEDGKTVREQVIYWRKSNQVHNWFVTNAQDGEDNCQPHLVTREQLTELKSACNISYKCIYFSRFCGKPKADLFEMRKDQPIRSTSAASRTSFRTLLVSTLRTTAASNWAS